MIPPETPDSAPCRPGRRRVVAARARASPGLVEISDASRPLCAVFGGDDTMKVRNSLRSLKQKAGSIVVRRGGRTVIINKRHPRWKARQG